LRRLIVRVEGKKTRRTVESTSAPENGSAPLGGGKKKSPHNQWWALNGLSGNGVRLCLSVITAGKKRNSDRGYKNQSHKNMTRT